MRNLVIAAIIIVLCAGAFSPVIGLDFGDPKFTDMDQSMVQFGQALTGANNIVTAVVFDFRGFDTLGEATVLFTAVLGIGLMFRKRTEDEEYEYE
jgi:multisubunit Na+/H+ antiporter MnhB subunit